MDDETKRPRGRPRLPPEQHTSQLAIRVTDAERGKLRALADEADVSMSAYIVGVLRDHMAAKD